MNFAQNLKLAMTSESMTMYRLAKELGVHQTTIKNWLEGKGEPRISEVQAIADALDIPVGELLGTMPQPDREYERVCDTLEDAGIALEATGWGDGSGPDGDHYYVWHKDSENPEEEREEYSFRELREVLERVGKDADGRRRDYFRKRLDAELF